MKVGDRVKHAKLGEGIILEFCRYGGVIVNYTDDHGVLVRVSHKDTLEIIGGKYEQKRKTRA